MQRREFLKLSGAALGSTLLLTGLSHQLAAALPVEAQSRGRHFRGYRNDGDIFVSEDLKYERTCENLPENKN